MNINFIPAWDQGVLKPLEKLEVHKRGLRHKAVSVFLISDNNVLIQKRVYENKASIIPYAKLLSIRGIEAEASTPPAPKISIPNIIH